MKMRRYATFAVLVMVMCFASGQAAAQDMKLGVVDLARALNESESGKKAKADLEVLIKAKQSVIDEKGKEIEKLKADLEKQASVLSADARKTREDELERLLREYQRLVSDSQSELKKKEGELTGSILKELRQIIQKVGQDEGYTLVIEDAEGIILFSKKELDLTDSLIKKYNETKAKAKK